MKLAKELKSCGKGKGKSSPYSKKFDLGQKSKLTTLRERKLRDALDKVYDYVYLINCVLENEVDPGSTTIYSIKDLTEFVKNDPELLNFFKRYDPLPDYCTLNATQSAPQKLYRLLIVRLKKLKASFPEVISILGDFLSLAREEFRWSYRYRQMREYGLGERIRRERRIYNKDRAQWCKDRGLGPPRLHDPYGPLELYFRNNYQPRFEGDKLLTRLEDGEKPKGSHDLPFSLRKARKARENAANAVRKNLERLTHQQRGGTELGASLNGSERKAPRDSVRKKSRVTEAPKKASIRSGVNTKAVAGIERVKTKCGANSSSRGSNMAVVKMNFQILQNQSEFVKPMTQSSKIPFQRPCISIPRGQRKGRKISRSTKE